MDFGRRLLPVLFLVFILVGLTSSRTIKTRKNLSIDNFHHQEKVKEMELVADDEVLKKERLLGRMNLELTDYPGTGANNNHDPSPPGKRV